MPNLHSRPNDFLYRTIISLNKVNNFSAGILAKSSTKPRTAPPPIEQSPEASNHIITESTTRDLSPRKPRLSGKSKARSKKHVTWKLERENGGGDGVEKEGASGISYSDVVVTTKV